VEAQKKTIDDSELKITLEVVQRGVGVRELDNGSLAELPTGHTLDNGASLITMQGRNAIVQMDVRLRRCDRGYVNNHCIV